MTRILVALMLLLLASTGSADSHADDRVFKNLDVFDLEWALDPQISPDGRQILYTRLSLDIMKDRPVTHIWSIDTDGGNHRPVLSGTASYSSVEWSPDGSRIAYVTNAEERGAELFVRWMDTGQTALLSNLPKSPGSITWSPDGKHLAFQMFVEDKPASLASPPPKPEGAEWAAPVKVIDKYPYRRDGPGYLDVGFTHIFVIPADGGAPRQLTSGDHDHGGTLSWSPDSSTIVFSANRGDRIEDPYESDIWSVAVATGEMTQLTDNNGPDTSPQYSPDGKSIAYLGVVDKGMGYHNAHVYLLDVESGETRNLTPDLDRSVNEVRFASASNRMYIRYADRGQQKVALLTTSGRMNDIVTDLGSAGFGRPYASGSFSVAPNGTVAYTRGTPTAPAEVGVIGRSGKPETLTALNDDFFAQRTLGTVEEVTWQSSVGDYEIQGWLVKPPNFDPEKQYPLILEIHGGPFAAYGPHFSPEIQLFAAAGNLVLYTNPRGSTSYGYDFANEIHLNYPGQDYDDLISGVDAVIAMGNVDEDRLYVTGGSGGGVLSAWIVGKTDRFAAAAVQKPVINWMSLALTTDGAAYFVKYWFDQMPWDDYEAYWRRSPLSLVGNVTTPTMLITGENDFRTPIPESEQYYQALKLRGVDTALVRVPERSHTLVARPSHLIAKVDNILGWFAKYPGDEKD
ncbi:MAG: S9 family peptidase [Woeseiaceae bacterium]|nr:S9 family peptidase [Woeseiaceae bacterium]